MRGKQDCLRSKQRLGLATVHKEGNGGRFSLADETQKKGKTQRKKPTQTPLKASIAP